MFRELKFCDLNQSERYNCHKQACPESELKFKAFETSWLPYDTNLLFFSCNLKKTAL